MDNTQNAAPAADSQVTPETQAPEIQEQQTQEVQAAAPEATAKDAAQLNKLENKDTSKMSKTEKQAHEKKVEKFKLKVYGKEVEEELDLNDREAVTKKLQMAHAANEKMRESAEMKRAAEEFITMLKTDPRRVLTDPNIGVDLKKLAQEILEEEIANAQKSPEQLEKEKLQKELQSLKEKYEKEEQTRVAKERERLQKEHEVNIQNNIESALKTSDLPKTPYTVRKMAEMMMIALQNNVDLSPNDIVPLIRKQMQSDIKELFGAASDDVIEELVGKDRLSSIRKKKVAAVKQAAQTANQVKQTSQAPKEESPKPKKTIKDWLNS